MNTVRNELSTPSRVSHGREASRALVLTTLDEIDGLKAVWNLIPFKMFDEVLVVDGHSTDGTIEFLEERGIRVIEQTLPGRGNAIREAIEKAKSEIIVIMASDGNDNPRYVQPILEKLREGYDLVTGSRFMKGGSTDDSDDPFGLRRLGNKLFTLIVNILWGSCLTDSTYGLRAFRKEAWEKMGIVAHKNETEFLMSIRASRLNVNRAEVPVVEGRRRGGKVKARSVSTGLSLVRVAFSEILNRSEA